jgi:hypothetical protein
LSTLVVVSAFWQMGSTGSPPHIYGTFLGDVIVRNFKRGRDLTGRRIRDDRLGVAANDITLKTRVILSGAPVW